MGNRNTNRIRNFRWYRGALIAALIMLAVVYLTEVPESMSVASDGGPTLAEATSLAEVNSAHRTPHGGQLRTPTSDSSGSNTFTTTIRRPTGPPTIELSEVDPQGRSGQIACSSCHSVRKANFATKTPADLDQFHQNMQMAHGTLSCYSCHNPSDADTLRLADSTTVEYPDVMTLCAQCHGTQARDYEHGAHGGMNGYWDLSRGPRTRNNCIDCHDPHVPKFPSMKPTFKPRDRFLSPGTLGSNAHGSNIHGSTPLGSKEANHE